MRYSSPQRHQTAEKARTKIVKECRRSYDRPRPATSALRSERRHTDERADAFSSSIPSEFLSRQSTESSVVA